MIDWSNLRALLLDMDGVLYRDTQTLPGAHDLLAVLNQYDIAFVCLTNNSTRTATAIAADLHARGIQIAADQIETSSTATAEWLRERYAQGTRIYGLGMEGLQEALFADDYFTPAERDVELVVVGAHFELRYEHLRVATLAIRAGARFIATNADTTFPTAEGLIPGAGAIVAAVAAATDQHPTIIGKPQPAMFEAALQRLGVPAAQSAMIGDRLDTDIAGAHNASIPSIFVASGVHTAEQARAWSPAPDLICQDLAEVLQLLRAGRTA